MIRGVLAVLAVIWLGLLPLPAQELSARARLEVAASRVASAGQGLDLRFALTQSVPWRVRVLADPPRLVIDTREVDWSGVDGISQSGQGVVALRAGMFRPGWTRLVLELSAPMTVTRAGMTVGAAQAVIDLRLDRATPEVFAEMAARPDPEGWALPQAADVPPPATQETGRLLVVLDPGHGGLDPGAEAGGTSEAALVLIFARVLKEELLRSGDYDVLLTRDDDIFVPLEARVSIARAVGAHVFLSLHADALSEGNASGATLYTLSDEASDAAAATLAERHDRDDLLAGVDLTEQDDLVAHVLMDMARNRTAPRVTALADALEAGIRNEGLQMHRRPHQSGSFSVLKSPDIPALLIELGFLTSPRDFERLTDAQWRLRMAKAIRAGLDSWRRTEAVQSGAKTP